MRSLEPVGEGREAQSIFTSAYGVVKSLRS